MIEVRCPYCGQVDNIEIEKNKTFITRCNYCCKGFAFRKIEIVKTFKIGWDKND